MTEEHAVIIFSNATCRYSVAERSLWWGKDYMFINILALFVLSLWHPLKALYLPPLNHSLRLV